MRSRSSNAESQFFVQRPEPSSLNHACRKHCRKPNRSKKDINSEKPCRSIIYAQQQANRGRKNQESAFTALALDGKSGTQPGRGDQQASQPDLRLDQVSNERRL